MKAHIIENNKVINTIEVDSLDFMPNLVDGSVGDIGWDYINGELIEPTKTVEVPQTITDLQAWQVLAQIGKLDAVKAMAEADVLFGIWFDRALVWERTNQYVISAGVTLGLTDAEIDDLFILGATL